jgi:uncharacterized protein YkwD
MWSSRSHPDTAPMARLSAGFVFVVALVVAGSVAGFARAATLPARAHVSRASSGAQGIKMVPALESQMLEGINDLRSSQGLAPLRLSAALSNAARLHSESMAEAGFFDHTSANGVPFWKRIGAKYPQQRSRLWKVGENLVWGTPGLSAQVALGMWLKSPGHRENLLTPAWREIGLGAVHALAAPGVYGGSTVTILTADFGVRR